MGARFLPFFPFHFSPHSFFLGLLAFGPQALFGVCLALSVAMAFLARAKGAFDAFIESADDVLLVAVLGPMLLAAQDQFPLFRYAMAEHLFDQGPLVFRQKIGIIDVEDQLHTGFRFIHVLPAGPGAA